MSESSFQDWIQEKKKVIISVQKLNVKLQTSVIFQV